jgi:hypothetical protein
VTVAAPAVFSSFNHRRLIGCRVGCPGLPKPAAGSVRQTPGRPLSFPRAMLWCPACCGAFNGFGRRAVRGSSGGLFYSHELCLRVLTGTPRRSPGGHQTPAAFLISMLCLCVPRIVGLPIRGRRVKLPGGRFPAPKPPRVTLHFLQVRPAWLPASIAEGYPTQIPPLAGGQLPCEHRAGPRRPARRLFSFPPVVPPRRYCGYSARPRAARGAASERP